MPETYIYKIFAYISIFVWLLPIFKQKRTKYFSFFLIVGLNDILIATIQYFLRISSPILYCISLSILIYLLLNNIVPPQKLLTVVLILLSFLIFIYYLDIRYIQFVILTILFLAVFCIFAYDFLSLIVTDFQISIPLLILLFYLLLNIAKFLSVTIYNQETLFYFYVTSALQVFIGLFFSFVRIDNQHLIFRIDRNKFFNKNRQQQ